MDQITHTLTAIALSHTGLNRKTRFATLSLVVGANLPDVDMLSQVAGPAAYLKHYRGFAHSLLGVTALAALAGVAIWYFGRRITPKRSAPPLDLRWLLGISWIATASHLLLDYSNDYGIRPFLPFSDRWYAWDVMPTLDPLLLALMVVGLGFPAILRLISEEVGAKKPDYRRGAVFTLCALAAVLGVRDLAHRRVLRLLDSHIYAQETPRRVGAFPASANPFRWNAIVETDSAFRALQVNALDPDVNPFRTRPFRKPEASPALEAAATTPIGATFLGFARFPWAQALETEDGYEITVSDLRFFSPASEQQAFVAKILLDRNLSLRSEVLRLSSEP